MRKTFGKLFIIFGVLLCIFALYGCAEVAETTVQSSEITTAEATETTLETSETTAEKKETESTAEETISNTEETSAEPTETETQLVQTCETEETSAEIESATTEAESLTSGAVETTENTSEERSETEETEGETTEETWISGTVVDDGSDLIAELVDYLNSLKVGHDMITYSVEDKIDQIKAGKQALHIAFDSTTSYYFVCGYLNSSHEFEDVANCCPEEYTWVRYRKENEIQEYYDGQKIAVAFQINKATFAKDILPSDKKVPEIEHFQLYVLEFVDGFNVKAPITFNETCIYLNSSDKKTVYYSKDKYNYVNCNLPCVFYNYQYYVIDIALIEYSDGSSTKYDFEERYGKYYDILMGIMIADRGVAVIGERITVYYCLIPLEDFVNNVLK